MNQCASAHPHEPEHHPPFGHPLQRRGLGTNDEAAKRALIPYPLSLIPIIQSTKKLYSEEYSFLIIHLQDIR